MARRDSFRGQWYGFASSNRNHPNTILTFVFFALDRSHGISHPLTVGTNSRLVYVSNRKKIGNRDWPQGGTALLRGQVRTTKKEADECQSEQTAKQNHARGLQ